MKTWLGILSVVLLAILGYLAYGFDQWLGIVAYTYSYLLFCLIAGLLFWVAWFPILKKRAFVVGAVVFAIFSANFFLPPPAERILRSVMLKLPPGTPSGSIESLVDQAYRDSAYKLPQITREETRVLVSLLSQESGNCTALIFQTKDGVIVSSEYSAD